MPLFWISLAFLCGILLSHSLSFPIPGWFLLALFTIILLLPPIFRRLSTQLFTRLSRITKSLKFSTPVVYPLMLLFFSVGAIRYQLAQPIIEPSFIAYYNDQSTETILEAVVVDPPDVRDTYINLRLRLVQIHSLADNQFVPVRGLLLARVSTSTSFLYGDRLRLQGHLETPPENEDFSYRDYLANQGIYSYIAYPATSLLEHG